MASAYQYRGAHIIMACIGVMAKINSDAGSNYKQHMARLISAVARKARSPLKTAGNIGGAQRRRKMTALSIT